MKARLWVTVNLRASIAMFLLIAANGCSFDPKFQEGTISCRTEKDCPPGYSCASSALCYLNGGARDFDADIGLQPDISMQPAIDAPVATSPDAPMKFDVLDDPPAVAHDAGLDDAGCRHICNLGDKKCDGAGVSSCVMAGSCPAWSEAVACLSRKVCQGTQPSAACGCPAPSENCSAGAGTACNGQTLITCAVDADNCTYEKSSDACPNGKPCMGAAPNAQCTCPAVPANCQNRQGTYCESNTNIVTCGTDANGCLGITQQTMCPGGKPCAGEFPSANCSCGASPAVCNNAAGNFCRNGSRLGICALDGNGCLAVTVENDCNSGLTCQGSHPNASCTCSAAPTECAGGNGNACRGNEVVTCGQNSSGCTVISNSSTCPAGKPCAGNHPTAACTCPTPPTVCAAGEGSVCSNGQVVTCVRDGNGCLGVQSTTGCTGTLTCQGSYPSAMCMCPAVPSACATGAGTTCVNGQAVTCGFDASGCLGITATTACTGSRTCQGSYPNAMCSCAATPAACANGAGTSCVGGQAVTCANDASGCLMVSATTTCTGSRTCQGAYPNAACTCPAAPADCSSAGNVCRAGALATCGLDASGCLATTGTTTCPGVQLCSGAFPNSACTCPAPTSECSLGVGSYCASSSTRVTCYTDANSCYGSTTVSCQGGSFCASPFPNGMCQAPSALGWHTDLGGMGNHSPNVLLGVSFTVTATVTLRHFGLISRAASNVDMVLYSGVTPTTLVASVSAQNVAVGRNEYAVTAQPTLAAGTYWIMAVFNATTAIAHDGTAATPSRYVAHTYSNPLPGTLSATTMYSGSNMNYYVLVLPQ